MSDAYQVSAKSIQMAMRYSGFTVYYWYYYCILYNFVLSPLSRSVMKLCIIFRASPGGRTGISDYTGKGAI